MEVCRQYPALFMPTGASVTSLSFSVHLGLGNKSLYLLKPFWMMYESLIKYFKGYANTPLTEDEIDLIQSFFIPKKFRKGNIFAGRWSVQIHGFIVKGAMRQYRVDDKGEEQLWSYIWKLVGNWPWKPDETDSFDLFYWCVGRHRRFACHKSCPDRFNRSHSALAEWIRNLDANFAIASQRRLNAALVYLPRNVIMTWKNPIPNFYSVSPAYHRILSRPSTEKRLAVFVVAVSKVNPFFKKFLLVWVWFLSQSFLSFVIVLRSLLSHLTLSKMTFSYVWEKKRKFSLA